MAAKESTSVDGDTCPICLEPILQESYLDTCFHMPLVRSLGKKRNNVTKGESFVVKKKQRKGTEMSCLPRDMEEEVLSRVPVRLMGELRSTCKKWNILTKSESFVVAKKKQKKGIEVVMMLDFRVSLMRVLSPSIERIGNLNADGLDISNIFHCDGLLLCSIAKDEHSSSPRLLVWNPFLGQTRWIEPTSCYDKIDRYGLGYDKEKKEHKVLRFLNEHVPFEERRICEFEIYSLHTNSWKPFYDKHVGSNPPNTNTPPEWIIPPTHPGLSLKGNTYWYAKEKGPCPHFLLSFDFTKERFGPRLPMPFHSSPVDTVTLSSVREEQLAVLFQKFTAPGAPAVAKTVKIWITTKIEPNAVSWSNLFLAVDMKPLSFFSGSFFVADQEKKVAVVLDRERDNPGSSFCNVAYIIGNNGYFKQVDLGQSRDHPRWCFPRVCSYVPSSVQIAPP